MSFALIGLILLLQGCSTKRNRWGNRNYHTINTYYNGYFNGEELLREAVATLEAGHRDDYYRILKVFPVGTLEDSKGIASQADNAIRKASVVIKKHSMYIKGQEYNKYIDDAYMLIGKSLFYKRDYYAALEMFNYVAKEPLKNNKRDPIAHIANAWVARAYAELGMYSEARMAFDRSLADKAMPKKAKAYLYAVLTDFWMKQNDIPQAIEAIDNAILNTKNKKNRRRLMFIRAQMHQEVNELKKAVDGYSAVLKMNPSYDMAFYSRINLARCYVAETGNSREMRELLAKMLRDEKNSDYYDQIHYTLGQLNQNEGNKEGALDEYNRSVRVSTVNSHQKGLSHLAQADIYFTDREYRISAAYYDSAVTFLSRDYPNFKAVENKRNSLADLVLKYETINRYDSLLRMSSLSKEQIEKKIDEIIKREEEEKRLQKEKEERLAAEQAAREAQAANITPGGTGGAGTGQWYFYNPGAMSFGFTEFRKVWGERRLEDNWRRKNKQAVLNFATGGEETQGKDSAAVAAAKPLTREDSIAAVREKYYQAIPQSDEQKQAYADTVMEAYYDLGLIYKERLVDLNEAIEVFELYQKKYPGSRNEATVWYQLYRIALAVPDQPRAEKYKGLLLSKYPDSEYSRIINDPEFFTRRDFGKKEADAYYEETFRLYQAGAYAEVLSRTRSAEIRFAENPLIPRFALLKALAIGHSRDLPAYRMALQDVVKNYPQDPVKDKARDLLAGLDKFQGIAPEPDSIPVKPSFTYRGDTTHFYVALIEDRALNLNDFKIKLSNFNQEYYSNANIRLSNMLLGTNYQVVLVQPFPNKKKAEEYMNALDQDDDVFNGMDMNVIDTFIISAGNFQKLLVSANVQEYLQFFKRVYQ